MEAVNTLRETWTGLSRQERIILALAMLFLLGILALTAYSMDAGSSAGSNKAERVEGVAATKAVTVKNTQVQEGPQSQIQPQQGEGGGHADAATSTTAGKQDAAGGKQLDAASAVDLSDADLLAGFAVADRESWLASDPALRAIQEKTGKSHEQLLRESEEYAAKVWASLGRRRALMERLYKPPTPVASDTTLGAALMQLTNRAPAQQQADTIEGQHEAPQGAAERGLQARISSLRQLAQAPPAMDKPPSEATQDTSWLEDYVSWLGPAWQGMRPHLNEADLRNESQGSAQVAEIDAALAAVLKAVGDLLAAIDGHRLEAAPGDAAILARVHEEMQRVYDEVVHPLYLARSEKARRKMLARRLPDASISAKQAR